MKNKKNKNQQHSKAKTVDNNNNVSGGYDK